MMVVVTVIVAMVVVVVVAVIVAVVVVVVPVVIVSVIVVTSPVTVWLRFRKGHDCGNQRNDHYEHLNREELATNLLKMYEYLPTQISFWFWSCVCLTEDNDELMPHRTRFGVYIGMQFSPH